MIELGISRISSLLQKTPLSWKAIHIAGTNGKGSISAYLSHLLTAGGVRCGRFTSPHLIDRWDCITINERVVKESLFRQVEEIVKSRDKQLGIGASEFELLTATAFEIFNRERVEVGVVEVGMGGRLDATNILDNVLVSIISKIGLDHQAFLGNSIEEIAREKAGILKPGVPCVVDGTNSVEVIQTVQARIKELGLYNIFTLPDELDIQPKALTQVFKVLDLQPHQRTNMRCAVFALQMAMSQLRPEYNVDRLIPKLSEVQWPGRLQNIVLEPLVTRSDPILLDGAHNSQSAEVLGRYVDHKLRPSQSRVTWVISASQGKDVEGLFGRLIKSGDNVAVTEFGPVDGMPWIQAMYTSELAMRLGAIHGIGEVGEFEGNIQAAINWGCRVANGGPLVIAGSLYLVSDVFRLLRAARRTKGEKNEQ